MWYCPNCCQWIQPNVQHNCGGTPSQTYPLGPLWGGCSCWQLLSELKRVADALEKLAARLAEENNHKGG